MEITSKTLATSLVESDADVQTVPLVVVEGGEVVGRLKVDIAERDTNGVAVCGWTTGEIEVWLTDGTRQLHCVARSEPREDVASHFQLENDISFGFQLRLEEPEPPQVLGLGWTTPSGPRWARLSVRDIRASASDAPEPHPDQRYLEIIADSGLFDERWYLSNYPDVGSADVNPCVHYYFQGGYEGRKPNYLFDSEWYLNQNPDVASSGTNPLVHYILFGESEGRAPSPYFDPTTYPAPPGHVPPFTKLREYLSGGCFRESPNRWFEVSYYLETYGDVREARVDPLLHYLKQGWQEGREINSRFSFAEYGKRAQVRMNSPVEPLGHYLRVGLVEGDELPSRTKEARGGDRLLRTLLDAQGPGPHFEPRHTGSELLASAAAQARVFAFYLPQFHPFRENDEWWGPGFTEWSNVTRALPRFVGHQQPRLPRDLGFYDLRNLDTLRAQVDLARRSGIAGFCFYYYWFDRKRLLERPLDAFVAAEDIRFPFCLMWANENWTRRWDGLESDVLMRQSYSVADDAALIDDFVRYFSHPSYERVDGRPLLIVYRPGIIPNAHARIARWRELFRERGHDPLLFMAQCFGDEDPRPFGLDGAIEFPPHKLAVDLPPANADLEILDPNFQGHYPKYATLVDRSLSVEPQSYDLIRTLVPSWDNEARKPGRGMGFVGANPASYERWLRALIEWSTRHPLSSGARYVFVNAWNEWAEGAHLEPDVHNGLAYLNATFRATVGIPPTGRGKHVLLVGHDAYLHGAQLLLLNIMRTMRRSFGCNVTLLLLGGGPLLAEYRRWGTVHVLENPDAELSAILDQYRASANGFGNAALCNTVVTGEVARTLAMKGMRVISLVHELPRLIRERALEDRVRALVEHSTEVLVAARAVQTGLESILGTPPTVRILPQGIYQSLEAPADAPGLLRRKLGLSDDTKIVINAGYGDLRKGFDLFVETTRKVASADRRVHFLWLGNVQSELETWLSVDRRTDLLSSNFHTLPFDSDIAPYLAGSDLLALTSREDPFPSSVLEALAAGLPVVAFHGGGGFEDAILSHPENGVLVPMADTTAMAAAIRTLIDQGKELRNDRAARSRASYDWREYVFELLGALYPGTKKVSVVVPNYRYERHIAQRLASIFDQDYPIYELIILDDASPDRSVEVIQECLRVADREATLLVNDTNSGSVFKQWLKAGRVARGELLWIAEADDAATSQFVSSLVGVFTDDTTLAFTDSRQIDGDGKVLGDSYAFYFRDLKDNPLAESTSVLGETFVRSALCIKNVILNVSAVIFDRANFLRTMERSFEDIQAFRMAGDWRLYVEMLSQVGSRVAYLNEPHNVHRRHGNSVTHALDAERHLAEIARVQDYAQQIVSLSAAERDAALSYRQVVREQFFGGANESENHR